MTPEGYPESLADAEEIVREMAEWDFRSPAVPKGYHGAQVIALAMLATSLLDERASRYPPVRGHEAVGTIEQPVRVVGRRKKAV